jgi:Domain of unknown function (DUF6484)
MTSSTLIDPAPAVLELADEAPDMASALPSALGALLLARPSVAERKVLPEVVVGELIAFTDNGWSPMVVFPGQPGSAALHARSAVDLNASHIGRQVVLSFENGDSMRPIVMGVLRAPQPGLPEAPDSVEVQADGARVTVHAKESLVLQCGLASITLAKSGRITLRGSYVLSQSTGRNRMTGGSIELN